MNATDVPSDDALRAERADLDAEYVRLTNDLAINGPVASNQPFEQRVNEITIRMAKIDVELVRHWHATRQAADATTQPGPMIDERRPHWDEVEEDDGGDVPRFRRSRDPFSDGVPLFEIVSLIAWLGAALFVFMWLSDAVP